MQSSTSGVTNIPRLRRIRDRTRIHSISSQGRSPFDPIAQLPHARPEGPRDGPIGQDILILIRGREWETPPHPAGEFPPPGVVHHRDETPPRHGPPHPVRIPPHPSFPRAKRSRRETTGETPNRPSSGACSIRGNRIGPIKLSTVSYSHQDHKALVTRIEPVAFGSESSR